MHQWFQLTRLISSNPRFLPILCVCVTVGRISHAINPKPEQGRGEWQFVGHTNNFIQTLSLQCKSCVFTAPNSWMQIHDLFNLLDTNHDGRISREDFIPSLRRNPLLIALFGPKLLNENLSEAEEHVLVEILWPKFWLCHRRRKNSPWGRCIERMKGHLILA